MVDNYSETLRALCLFILANAPAGAEASLERLSQHADNPTNYVHLEWRTERASCQMYVTVGKFGGERFKDAEGNTWATYDLEVQVSWPSWGADSVKVCQERLALMTAVARLAAMIESKFGGPITTMVELKTETEARLRKLDEAEARRRVEALIRANVKGMRVGQERRVEVPAEAPLLLIGEVAFCDGPRQYTTNVNATRAFYFMRTA